ncbi:MAG: hypothetical protein JW748_06735 [Anaerolineales bacterium]|nr:hypothetical protein [Anaerolineales bacterium]
MQRWSLIFMVFSLLTACNLGRIESAAPSGPGQTAIGVAGKRCGDSVCDGPESAGTCPQDCSSATNGPSATVQPSGAEVEAANLTPGTKANAFWMINPASGARLYIVVSYPNDGGASPLPSLVMIPGGLGAQDLENGTDLDAVRLSAAGFIVIQFDADGRGASGGDEDYNGFRHQDGLSALILSAGQIPRVDTARLGVISRSYGVTMAAGALGRHPDLPVRFYIDWEGPADRMYTTSGCTGVNRGIDWPSCDDESFWSEREAVDFIGTVRVPYLRIQSEKDHVQSTNAHAVDMINAAVRGGVPWARLNDNPAGKTYDSAQPPEMFPDTVDRQLPDLFIRYAGELFALEW